MIAALLLTASMIVAPDTAHVQRSHVDVTSAKYIQTNGIPDLEEARKIKKLHPELNGWYLIEYPYVYFQNNVIGLRPGAVAYPEDYVI